MKPTGAEKQRKTQEKEVEEKKGMAIKKPNRKRGER
jgi:hypothetical protein